MLLWRVVQHGIFEGPAFLLTMGEVVMLLGLSQTTSFLLSGLRFDDASLVLIDECFVLAILKLLFFIIRRLIDEGI